MSNVVKRPNLFSIVQNHWIQETRDEQVEYRISVKGEPVSDKEWNDIVAGIRRRFGENLIDITSPYMSNGVEFTVRLKKSVKINIKDLVNGIESNEQ